ncbi:MAG: hypothetical protein ACLQU3_16140 [Limisphaerales bacterium]
MKITYLFNDKPVPAPRLEEDVERVAVDAALGGFIRILAGVATPDKHERPTLSVTFTDDGPCFNISGPPPAVLLALESLGIEQPPPK